MDRLARDFEAVVLAARQEDELGKTATEVKSAGAEPLTYALDLREPRSVETLVQCTLDRFGRIDALLNIAGLVYALMTGMWRLKQMYEVAYFPIAGTMWALGAMGLLPRVKRSADQLYSSN